MDKFGIFFDSAEHHGRQHSVDAYTCKTIGAENLLQYVDCGCPAVIHDYLRGGYSVARSR
jgi:hypothetical protein